MRVEADKVARTDFADAATHQGFGRHVDGSRHFARCAGHAPVRYQRHFLPAVEQDGQRRREFVQFGHAVGARALVTHHADEIFAVQLAALEGSQHFALVVKHDGGRFDHKVLRFHGRYFNHAAADVAFHQFQATVG